MRTNNSIKNISISILSQIIIALLGFISRKVFLDSLGIDYLGVNGLLTNVLSMMALVEGGIGLSIVYNLYKPLAEDDRPKILALVQLYKKVYAILAVIIVLISISLYPFLGNVIKDGSAISNISIIYFLFVAKNMISYLNAHKWSLINADQKGYVLAKIDLLFQIITTVTKIGVLIATHNYILYLIIELIIFALQTVMNSRTIDKRYPYIKTKEKYYIDTSIKENIIKNVKALFLHNIGSYLVFGTDYILISSLISVGMVGFYSNYTMIIGQLSALLSPILGGIGASVGNLIATESSEKNYSIFKITYLVNFWLYSIVAITLYNVLEPFISWWLGHEYVMDHLIFIIILINFYITGLRTAIATFKTKAGLFVQDRYVPLLEGVLNLLSSFVLANYFGLAGILMGTTISTIATVFWTQPFIVYRNIFKRSIRPYFLQYFIYALLTLAACFITTLVCHTVAVGASIVPLVLRGLICLAVPNLLYLIIFYKKEEFQYILNTAKTNIFMLRKAKQEVKAAEL
jgi:O-antigen/teichoic acid export membrane protein